MSLTDALIVFSACALCVIALTACLNALAFPRLKQPSTDAIPAATTRVSILIPARNEAAVIGATVRSLLSQSHQDFELLLLDDHSTDGTRERALDAANGDARLRIVSGEALPDGWLGKNWACWQLAQAALQRHQRHDDGEHLLIFCDADVQWTPGALAALVAEMGRRDLAGQRPDLLTVWSTQETVTWGERLVVPLMALVILGYLPYPLVQYTPWSAFAAANGQCLAFRRQAYETIGGHAAVRASIVEDITFARKIKRAKLPAGTKAAVDERQPSSRTAALAGTAFGSQLRLRLRMADGAGVIGCRMYRDWSGVRDGYAKNILAGYGGRISLLALATVFHYLVFFMPWVWALSGYPTLPLIALGVGTRMLTAASTRQRLADALLMPISVLLMTIIAAQAVYWRMRYGGARWKGRTIRA
jgi:chlorobactene glucosyltransferase